MLGWPPAPHAPAPRTQHSGTHAGAHRTAYTPHSTAAAAAALRNRLLVDVSPAARGHVSHTENRPRQPTAVGRLGRHAQAAQKVATRGVEAARRALHSRLALANESPRVLLALGLGQGLQVEPQRPG